MSTHAATYASAICVSLIRQKKIYTEKLNKTFYHLNLKLISIVHASSSCSSDFLSVGACNKFWFSPRTRDRLN